MKFRELLAKTQFIKKYTNRRPKIDLITEAIMVANEGPLAGNLQPFQYVIVRTVIRADCRCLSTFRLKDIYYY